MDDKSPSFDARSGLTPKVWRSWTSERSESSAGRQSPLKTEQKERIAPSTSGRLTQQGKRPAASSRQSKPQRCAWRVQRRVASAFFLAYQRSEGRRGAECRRRQSCVADHRMRCGFPVFYYLNAGSNEKHNEQSSRSGRSGPDLRNDAAAYSCPVNRGMRSVHGEPGCNGLIYSFARDCTGPSSKPDSA